jgi:hypothetical protein
MDARILELNVLVGRQREMTVDRIAKAVSEWPSWMVMVWSLSLPDDPNTCSAAI